MEELILKSSFAIAISYLLYFWLIRKSTSFKWIRVYFLIVLLASLSIPLLIEYFAVKQQIWVQVPAEYIRKFLQEGQVDSDTSGRTFSLPFSFSGIVFHVYIAGVFLVLLRFLIGFFHLLFLTFKFGIQKVGTDRLVILQNLSYPFSFLHLIFINRQTLTEANNGAMLQHERAHIRQWHSLDIILLELLVAFQWFNPFAWLFRRSVKELHEYLADEEVIRNQGSSLEYQQMLFNQACGTNFWQPVSGFQSSLTKKRILMMNNKRNKKWFAVFAAIIVSIFAIQTFSRINFAQDPPKSKKDKQMVVIRNAQDDTSKMGSLPPPPPPPPPFPYFSGTSDFNESNMAFGNYILKNIQVSPADFAGKKKKSGVFVVISFDNKGNVLNAEKGFIPKGFSSDDVKFTEDQTIISELIKVIKNAPAFTIENSEDGYLSQVNYGIIYGDNTCKVMPVHYVFKDNTDSPVSPKVSLPKDM